ncbi:MAG: hypothetical protein ABIJ09_14675 [Pseudomonadota bacterium]
MRVLPRFIAIFGWASLSLACLNPERAPSSQDATPRPRPSCSDGGCQDVSIADSPGADALGDAATPDTASRDAATQPDGSAGDSADASVADSHLPDNRIADTGSADLGPWDTSPPADAGGPSTAQYSIGDYETMTRSRNNNYLAVMLGPVTAQCGNVQLFDMATRSLVQVGQRVQSNSHPIAVFSDDEQYLGFTANECGDNASSPQQLWVVPTSQATPRMLADRVEQWVFSSDSRYTVYSKISPPDSSTYELFRHDFVTNSTESFASDVVSWVWSWSGSGWSSSGALAVAIEDNFNNRLAIVHIDDLSWSWVADSVTQNTFIFANGGQHLVFDAYDAGTNSRNLRASRVSDYATWTISASPGIENGLRPIPADQGDAVVYWKNYDTSSSTGEVWRASVYENVVPRLLGTAVTWNSLSPFASDAMAYLDQWVSIDNNNGLGTLKYMRAGASGPTLIESGVPFVRRAPGLDSLLYFIGYQSNGRYGSLHALNMASGVADEINASVLDRFRFSPSGTQVALSINYQPATEIGDLVVAGIPDLGSQTLIASDVNWQTGFLEEMFSPDEAYFIYGRGTAGSSHGEVKLVTLADGSQQILAQNAKISDCSFSPGSQYAVLEVELSTSSQNNLVLVDLVSGTLHIVDRGSFFLLGWRGDDSFLYTKYQQSTSQLWLATVQ